MENLLPTKFFLPPAPGGFVVRPQLIADLDQALKHRLTLVSAPAGAGKTTLVSNWIQKTRAKGVAFGWLSLDDSDNDLKRFLEYMLASLEEGGLTLESVAIPAALEGNSQMESVMGDLIRCLMGLKREMILFLDDYHLIQNKEVHNAVEYLVDHAPPCFHLAILTRSDPPLRLARMRVSGYLTELRMENLRFSVQEAGEFLEKSAGLQLTQKDLTMLTERTEGWIAGLQMAAISLRGREDAAAFVAAFAGSHRFVFDYLLEQVLSRQPDEVREFLLKTSVLERLSGPLCEAVTGMEGSGAEMLDALEKANLFLVPLDDERRWYRYHHLFSDLLRLMLEHAYPGVTPELHKRACRWYESHEMMAEALHHALSSGDMQLVAQIVSANVLVLVENDEAVPTLQKIDSVPEAEMVALPWLGIARAWVMGAGQLQKSRQVLDAVEKSLESMPDGIERQRLAGHIAAARAFVFSVMGDKENTIAQARLANDLLPADEIAVRAMTLTIWGDMRSDDRRHDPANMPILEQALALALQAKKPHVAVIAAGVLASANLHAGRLGELHHVCLEALEIGDEYQKRNKRPLSASASVYSLLARVLAEWGENEQAIQYARKGLLLSESWGQLDSEVMCLNYLGRALVFGNDNEQALQVFQRALTTAEKVSPWYCEMTVAYTLDSLLDNDKPDADEIARLKRLLKQYGVRNANILTARLLLRENQPEQALELLEKELAYLHGQPSFDIVRIHCLIGLAHQARGNLKPAIDSLRQALVLAEPENRVATFVREGEPMERLLRLVRLRFINPDFVKKLLAAFKSRKKYLLEPSHPAEGLVEPLSERELEVLGHLNGPLSTPEISEQLMVSANTVRTHIKSIYSKLGVHGRSKAVQQALELGLLTQ